MKRSVQPAEEGAVDLPDAEWRRSFRRRLRSWYRIHARELPWRDDPTVYRVWVSEVMLQQTQVATVVPYFERFMAAFPTVEELARADDSAVLRLWEGLGYYRRARQLHAAAKQVVQQYHGQFPRDIEQVRGLPGIGRYTAGAILSIACDLPHPILEANTIRLFSRLVGFHGDPTRRNGQKLLWRFAQQILPTKEPGTLNQALMELGSEICTPRRPSCGQCPARSVCVANDHGWQSRIPRSTKRVQYEDVVEAAVVVWRRDKVLIRQCAPDERWAGLWDFPRFALDCETPQKVDQELAERTAALTGFQIRPTTQLLKLEHGVTRFRITLHCHQALYVAGRKRRGTELRWVTPKALDDFALSATGRKIARRLRSNTARRVGRRPSRPPLGP